MAHIEFSALGPTMKLVAGITMNDHTAMTTVSIDLPALPEQPIQGEMLANLLAVIHQDGGHYVEEHGCEKACADAESVVVNWLMRNEVERQAVTPAWTDGVPANLAGAAMDALEWLRLIERLQKTDRWKFSQPDRAANLQGCIGALENQLALQIAMPVQQEEAHGIGVCKYPDCLENGGEKCMAWRPRKG